MSNLLYIVGGVNHEGKVIAHTYKSNLGDLSGLFHTQEERDGIVAFRFEVSTQEFSSVKNYVIEKAPDAWKAIEEYLIENGYMKKDE